MAYCFILLVVGVVAVLMMFKPPTQSRPYWMDNIDPDH